MAFHVGQKVACVRDGWDQYPDGFTIGPPLPKAGVEYIVRTIEPATDGSSGAAIRLLWMHYPILPSGIEPSFAVIGRDGVANFRPVIERSTEAGMAILRKVADGVSRKIRERI